LVRIALFAVALIFAVLLSFGTSFFTIQARVPEETGQSVFGYRHVGNDYDGEDAYGTTVLVEGAPFHGANGINFDAQDRLYVASVDGSTISIMDPKTGKIIERLGPKQGVIAPDDMAFGPDGSLYWTGLFTGEVGRLTRGGVAETVAELVPGANAITFSDDGRLFVSQCFFGDKLYEVDPDGLNPPRLISDALGPGCALNGMDWGPDGYLYGPRWFQGEVVRVDVDSGEFETVVDGIGAPAAVKFDSQGRLHVLDAQSGRVLRVDVTTGDQKLVATLDPGLDNLAFDSRDRLFVSSYADSFIVQVLKNGATRIVSKGGMSVPGGVAVLPNSHGESVYVADFFSLRAFDGLTGKQESVQRSIIRVSAFGFPLTASQDGANLLLTSWPDNLVQVLDPETGAILETHRDFAVPLNAIRFQGDLVVAELGTGSVVRASSENPATRTTLVEGLGVPAGLAATDTDIWVSDWAAGSVLQIVAAGEVLDEPVPIAEGLAFPEGLALAQDGSLLVVESGAGRLSRIDLGTGQVTTVAEDLEFGAQAPPNVPPTWIFNGVAVGPSGNIYVTGDVANVLYRITLSPHQTLIE
jgi:sugar lactone lactonase YvrE